MAQRISGKNAGIRLEDGDGIIYDLSGVAADGRGRANAFNFNLAGNVVEAVGYVNAGVSPIPTGQTRVSGSFTVFYSSNGAESEERIERLYDEQHAPDDCEDAASYTLYVRPEGDCDGTTEYTIHGFVMSDYDVPLSVDGVVMITVNWQGWRYVKAAISCEVQIDDLFTQANGAPADWTAVDYGTSEGLTVVSNELRAADGATGGEGGARHDDQLCTYDQFSSVILSDIAAADGSESKIHVRGNDDLSIGYRVGARVTPGSSLYQIFLYRVIDGTEETLAFESLNGSGGNENPYVQFDYLMIKALGTTISAGFIAGPNNTDYELGEEVWVLEEDVSTYEGGWGEAGDQRNPVGHYVGLFIEDDMALDNFMARDES